MQHINPKTGILQSDMGRDCGWSNQLSAEVYESKRTKIGSITRRKTAEKFLRSALKSLGTIEPSLGSKDIAIGVNTWVVPYLENAIALLSGEDERIDW